MGVSIHKRRRTIPNNFEYPYFQTTDKFLTRLQKERDFWVGTDLTSTGAILCTDFESRKPVVLYMNNKKQYKCFFEYEIGCLTELQDEKLENALSIVLNDISRTYIIQVSNRSGLFIASETEMSVFIMKDAKHTLMKYQPEIATIEPFNTISELHGLLNPVTDINMEELIDKMKSIWLMNDLLI